MPVLIGELEKITGSPSSVTQVMVRAHTTRITGAALTTDELVPIPVDQQGRFEVPLRPGKAVLVLVHGGRVGEGERFPMLVEEGLGTIVSAIKLASDRFDDYEINELEQAAADMLAHIDKAAVSATSAGKDAGRAEAARQGAETIEKNIPTKVGEELATQLPGELDERVPPMVASSIADDRAVADAAAAAVVDAVDEAMPSKADTTYVDEQDQALGERIDDAEWFRGGLGSSDNLDDYHGLDSQGLYRVTTAVGGGTGLPGWVEVTYDGNSARTRQVFTASSPSDSVSLERKYSGGSWRDWSPVTWHGVVVSSGSADDLTTPHVYAINSSGVANLPAPLIGSLEVLPAGVGAATLTQIFTSNEGTPRTWKRTRLASQWNEWVQLATGQDVARLIDDAQWYRGGLNSTDHLDTLTGTSSVGLYPVTGAVGGLPGSSPGTVHITYDSSSSRTVQVYTPSSPAERVTMRRVHQGTWRDWEPTTYAGLYVSTGHVDNLTIPHVYAVAGTVAGLPVAENTSLEVMQAGAGTAQLIQRATTLEVRPRTFVRRRQWSRWGEWVEDGKDTSPAPITWDLVETTNADAQLIAGSMSHDRLTLFNSVGGPLRQSRDNGQTWEEVYRWPGSALEVTLPLANGEILVVTNSAYEGQTSMRRVWVSEGYDPDNPQAATWVHKLTGSARMVKFPEWSLNTWDNIVLASEYGPKGGMIWAGNPDPIEEGKNARYAYLSTDYGETWKQVFDLNSWLRSRGENTLKRHIHGIAWDPYWDRIWLTFGDHPTDNGSNGILYSDDFGDTWEIAYHSAEVDEHLGFQVVGIQPMRDAVLFAGDMTPAGVIRIDRAGGKYRDAWEFPEAWSLGDEHKILCHVIRHHQDGFGEVAFFGFSREGSASPSIIVATRDGYDWDLLWESGDAPSPGFRWMAGPTMDGQLIASVNRGGVWTELSGKIDLHNFTQSQLAARDARFAAHRELVMTPEQVGRIATEKASGKADAVHEHTASQIIDLHHYSGTGFPEGKVAAPVGATYVDTAATNGAIRWIKTSGTGNTGWQVEYGETGWRNINSLLAGVEFSGSVLIRRRADWLDFRFAWFHPDGVANISFTVPPGWRGVNNDGATLLNGSGAPAADLRIGWAGDVTIRRTANQSLDCTVSIPAHSTWPGSYIGTPA